jgi:hypothetical protein
MIGESSYVKRVTLIVCCTLVLTSGSAFAQYQGGGGGHHNVAPPPGPTPETKNNDLKGFERAVALQATPEQIAQFRELSASTEAARKNAQDLLRLPETASKPDWIHTSYPLTNELEETTADNDKFLLSLSKEQEQGLKKLTKKLRKTGSELTSQSRALILNLEKDDLDGKQMADLVQKLDKALSDLHSQQLAIAAEMGIQSPTTKSQ